MITGRKNKSLPKRKQHIDFNVSNTHINAAVCGDARHCAVALCMAEKLNLAHGYIHVSAQGLKFTKGNVRWRAFVSNRLLNWFLQFDQWGKGLAERPGPFRFEAAFEAYAWKKERDDKDRINANRNKKNAELRANGRKPKTYNRRERLVGASLTAA
jgi:hypothetical protein